MSLHRLVAAQKLATTSRGGLGKVLPGVRSSHLVRWQSQTAPKGQSARGGRRATRLLLYGVTATGLSLGATLVYANYDPVFKYKVGLYVPGFARMTDLAADRWVDLVDYINPKGGADVGLKGGEEVRKSRPRLGLERRSEGGRATGRIGTQDTHDELVEQKSKLDDGVKTEASTPPPPLLAFGKDMKMIEEELKGIEKEVKAVEEEVRAAEEKELVRESAGDKPGDTTHKVKAPEAPTTEAERSTQHEDVIIPAPPVEPGMDTSTMEGASPQEQKDEAVPEEVSGKRSLAEPTAAGRSEPELAASVESAVASAKEETARASQEIISEQIKEHQEAQSSDEHFQWLKDSSQVEAMLQRSYDDFVAVTEKVLEAQKGVTQAIKDHHHKLTEATTAIPADEKMESVAEGIARAGGAVDVAREELQAVQEEHKEMSEGLGSLLERAMDLGLKSKVEQVHAKVTEAATELLTGAASIAVAESNNRVMEEYQGEAERIREELQRELGTTLPKADSQQEALLLLLQRRVEVLKGHLKEVEEEQKRKLAEALEHQKDSLEQLYDNKAKWMLQKQENDFHGEMGQRLEEIARQYEGELREQLRITANTHTNHLEEALQTQADRLSHTWASELEQKLREQEAHYQKELAKAMAQLRGVESMVDSVIDAGEITRHQQNLRAACDSLNSALHLANSNPDQDQRYLLGNEVASLREAAKEDRFVLSILDTIPQEAVTVGGGLQSEAGLMERFKKVKRICKRVSLVPQSGGGLGTYALSYLQSLLVIKTSRLAPYIVDSKTDPSEMDNFELLQQADTRLHQGELREAVEYVNQLQGEARRVAQDWLVDARLYLETRQAVELVLCHMAATSVSLARTN